MSRSYLSSSWEVLRKAEGERARLWALSALLLCLLPPYLSTFNRYDRYVRVHR